MISLSATVFTCGHAQHLFIPILPRVEIFLDGKLTEKVWKQALVLDSFVLHYPRDSGTPLAGTRVFLLADRRALYVGAICHQPEGYTPVTPTLRRDFSIWETDALVVVLDPDGDKEYGVSFGVSTYGAQRDGLITHGGAWGVSTTWDNKWFSAVARDSQSWSVELIIPFKAIRYRKGDTLWHINFIRTAMGIPEISVWKPVPRQFNPATLAFAGQVVLTPPTPHLNAVFIPYATGIYEESRVRPRLGTDIRVMLTPALTLDLTLNPDFSQIEVDEQVVNLSRFEIWVPEKRQFFLENSDLFSAFGLRHFNIFFSRKVGLYELAPFTYEEVPIAAGLKLSGQLSRGTRMGLLGTYMPAHSTPTATDQSDTVVLPARVVAVATLQPQVPPRPSFIRVQMVSVEDLSPRWYNHLAGIEYNLRTRGDLLRATAMYATSLTTEIDRANHAGGFFVRYRGRRLLTLLSGQWVGEGFRAALGFLPRQLHYDASRDTFLYRGYSQLGGILGWSWYPSGRWTKIDASLEGEQFLNEHLKPWLRELSVTLTAERTDGSTISIGGTLREERLEFDSRIYGVAVIPTGTYRDWRMESILARSSKYKLSGEASLSAGTLYGWATTALRTAASWRATPRLLLKPSVTYSLLDTSSSAPPIAVTHLSLWAIYTFTTHLYLTFNTQLNTQYQLLTLYGKLQWRFAPVSDLFIVIRLDRNLKNRSQYPSFAVKLTYWLNT